MKYTIALAMGVNLSAIFLEDSILEKRIQYNKNRLLVSVVLNREVSQEMITDFYLALQKYRKTSMPPVMDMSMFDCKAVESMDFCIDYTQEVSHKLH